MPDKENVQINALKEAIKLSPNNKPLRGVYADALIRSEMFEEAVRELNILIKAETNNIEFRYKLADIYNRQNKPSNGIVLLEDYVKREDVPDKIMLLFVNLLLKEKNPKLAATYYERLKKRNAEIKDEYLDDKLSEYLSVDLEEDDKICMPTEGDDDCAEIAPIEKPDISFKDVGGMDAVKDDISIKIIAPQKHAQLFKSYGKKAGGGILLFGPPGCGKTYIAKATAGEINAAFMAVELHDVLDMYYGESERQLHQIFENARKHTPCVLFFDEVDALGAKRSHLKLTTGRNLINQFLAELDGIKTSNDGILILAATNAPWHIDPAFKRPGRFDKIVFIPPPDEVARKAILKIVLRNIPSEGIDFDYLAKITNDFSGADLKSLVNTAVEEKLKHIMKSGVESPLALKDIKSVVKLIKPSIKDWFATARNYAVYSNQSGLYDDILKYLGMYK